MAGTRVVGVGLVGAGAMGRIHVLAFRIAHAYGGLRVPVRLRVIAEAEEARARAAAATLDFEAWTTDWMALVSDPRVDVVAIATPNDLHGPVAIAASGAGKHVFCEKPLATHAREAEDMWRAAEANRVVHMVNFNYRQFPAVQLARQLVEGGRIGAVRHFRGTYLQDWGNDPDVPYSWKFQARRSGAGVLAGIGSHLVDMARYMVGEIVEVVSATRVWVPARPSMGTAGWPSDDPGRHLHPVDVEDAACLLARFKCGALGTFDVSRCAPGRKNHFAFEVHGEVGSLYFDAERPNELGVFISEDRSTEGFRRVLLGPAHSPRVPLGFAGIPVGFVETVVFQVDAFLRAVVEGTRASPDFYDGWRAQAVLDAALRSAGRGPWTPVAPPATGART